MPLEFLHVSVPHSDFISLQPHSSNYPSCQSFIFNAVLLDPATWHTVFLLSNTFLSPSPVHGVSYCCTFPDLGSNSTSSRNPSLASLTRTSCPCLGSHGPIYLLHSIYHRGHFIFVSSTIERTVSLFTHDFVSQGFAQFCL